MRHCRLTWHDAGLDRSKSLTLDNWALCELDWDRQIRTFPVAALRLLYCRRASSGLAHADRRHQACWVRVRVLGVTELADGPGGRLAVLSHKQRALLAALILHRGSGYGRRP